MSHEYQIVLALAIVLALLFLALHKSKKRKKQTKEFVLTQSARVYHPSGIPAIRNYPLLSLDESNRLISKIKNSEQRKTKMTQQPLPGIVSGGSAVLIANPVDVDGNPTTL